MGIFEKLKFQKVVSLGQLCRSAFCPPFACFLFCMLFSMMGALSLYVNVYMRIMNGNTTSDGRLSFAFVNADGVMGQTRAQALLALNSDVVAIGETHLSKEQQPLMRHAFHGYDCHWGAPVSGKNGGVGFLVRRGSCWRATLVAFPPSSRCYEHSQAGRLAALVLTIGNGSRGLVCYSIYGYSGARWNLALKRRTNQIVDDVLADATVRGLPSLLGGDINLQLQESTALQRLSQLNWSHLPSICGMAAVPTCYKGAGSSIDHVFLDPLAMSAFDSFSVGERLSDHCPLYCNLSIGAVSQSICRSRSFGSLPAGYSFPPPLSAPTAHLETEFGDSLAQGNITQCFRIWSRWAETHLKELWQRVSNDTSFCYGRGCVRIDSHAVWPRACKDSAASLRDRRIWKQICRLVEVEKRPWGHLAAKTWGKVRDSISCLPPELMEEANVVLAETCSAMRASVVKRLFEQALCLSQSTEKKRRLRDWKDRLQNSVRAQHAWLRQDACSSTLNTNVVDQFAAVRDAWGAVADLFRHHEPDHAAFFDLYDPYITPVDVELPPLTGQILRDEMSRMVVSSPGLDAWCHDDLKLLSHCAPWVMDLSLIHI